MPNSPWYAIRRSTRTRHVLDYDRDRDVDKLHAASTTLCGQVMYPEDISRNAVEFKTRNCKTCLGMLPRQ